MNENKKQSILSGAELAKKQLEKKIGISYEEFEKLDADEQHKLLKKTRKMKDTYEFMTTMEEVDYYIDKITSITPRKVLKKVFTLHRIK